MPNPNGVVSGNSQNIPDAHTPRQRSTFPLHYHFFNTQRFGEYFPHYVADMEKNDNFPIHSTHDLRSYTLEAPLMQSVKRNKDYFLVPMEAILPNNWEKFYVNPVRGDDVLDDVGPSVENFWNKVGTFMEKLAYEALQIKLNTNITVSQALTAYLRYLIIGEYFYSNGNLLSSLDCHGAPYVTVQRRSSLEVASYPTYDLATWDDYFDYGISFIAACLAGNVSSGIGKGYFTLQVDGYMYVVSDTVSNFGFESISLRHALQLMRDNPTFVITDAGTDALSSGYLNPWSQFITEFDSKVLGNQGDFNVSFEKANVDCNLSRLWAYQLCCAHYFSNDHIDFVYSAELYRQLIGNYIDKSVSYSTAIANGRTFTRNGLSYRYDFMSAHFFTLFFNAASSNANVPRILTDTSALSVAFQFLGYISALFGFRRSLRYLDYFTGARSQPLAVVSNQVNTNVAVNNNMVSVIEITKNIQGQRFLNSVNRIRHNIEGYLKGVFGGDMPAPDYHNPFYLAHTDDIVYGQETENTADAQMSDKIAITTNLRSKSGNYMFDLTTDRPCIAIGITSYDIARVYSKTMDRSFLHKNRFDWFNPFMQYIGDQQIYLQELGVKPGTGSLNTLANFAYTLRHMEFKQRHNYCSGGFCVPSTNLQNWIFVARDRRGTQTNINPDWIRSVSAEFDQFYVSLTGYSLGTYYHFIVDDYNSCNASRGMAYAPQILG